jgi:hypothetical protein
MLQIIEQTDEEKLAMYMKLDKEEIAKMLIQSNKHLDALIAKQPYITPQTPFPSWPVTCQPSNEWEGKPWHGLNHPETGEKIGPTYQVTAGFSVNQGLAAGNKWCDCKNLEHSTAGFMCHGYCNH